MDPLAFATEEQGILSAEQALDALREFLHAASTAAGGNFQRMPRTPPAGLGDVDKEIALRTQLANLEEMMEMITDARFARSLIEDDVERVMVGQGEDEANLEMLRFIVMTAGDVLASQTYEHPGAANDYDDIGLSNSSITVGYVRSYATNDNPTCLVCEEPLPLSTGRLKTPCGHYYCSRCTVNLVETYTSKPFPSSPFRCCPSPKLPVPPQDVHRFIGATLRQRLDERLAEAGTPFDHRIYCPQDGCRQFINPAGITSGARALGKVICPNTTCRVNICLGCKELAHQGIDCERHADDTQAAKLQRDFGWGRCPGCRFVVEKVDGCNSVSCTRCGLGFTYSPMARN